MSTDPRKLMLPSGYIWSRRLNEEGQSRWFIVLSSPYASVSASHVSDWDQESADIVVRLLRDRLTAAEERAFTRILSTCPAQGNA